MKITRLILFSLCAACMVAGCAPVISREMHLAADSQVSISEIIEHPDSFKGSTVIWAGIIIETKNLSGHTIIEVLHRPADYQDRPRTVDVSEGRFLARKQGFLDPAVYSPGREVTIAGTVEGIMTSAIGEYEYTYPVITVKEIYLWSVEPEKVYNYLHYPSYYHYQWQYW
ncbi:MAG: Slp family lipoprotein [Deltaproteobacteria bacterium]|nr:Slp family lipoprotein [Deltaproteobacteria bacterium]